MENSEFEKSNAFMPAEILKYISPSVVIDTLIIKTTGHISADVFDSGEAMTVNLMSKLM